MFYDRYIALCVTSGEKPYSVAKNLGLSNSNVAQWKKGSTPRKEVLQRIAEYFNVSVAYLMGLEELPSMLELIAEDNGFESTAKMLREFRQKKEPPALGGKLDEEKLEFIKLYDRASPALRAAALAVLKSAESDRAAPGGEGGAG